MKPKRIMAAAGLVFGTALTLQVTRAQQPGIRRTDLQRHDLGVPALEVIQVRLDVLEGSLGYQVDVKPPKTLEAGDVLFIPGRTIHAAKNVGSRNGAELATYVVEKGKPLVVMVR